MDGRCGGRARGSAPHMHGGPRSPFASSPGAAPHAGRRPPLSLASRSPADVAGRRRGPDSPTRRHRRRRRGWDRGGCWLLTARRGRAITETRLLAKEQACAPGHLSFHDRDLPAGPYPSPPAAADSGRAKPSPRSSPRPRRPSRPPAPAAGDGVRLWRTVQKGGTGVGNGRHLSREMNGGSSASRRVREFRGSKLLAG